MVVALVHLTQVVHQEVGLYSVVVVVAVTLTLLVVAHIHRDVAQAVAVGAVVALVAEVDVVVEVVGHKKKQFL